LERWNLTTFQREESVPNPTGGEIKSLALGSASSGPLVVHAPSTSKSTLGIQLLDPRTFQPWNDSIGPIANQPFGIEVGPDLPCVSVSADGGLILLRGKFEFTVLSRQGHSWHGHNFGHAHMGGRALAAA